MNALEFIKSLFGGKNHFTLKSASESGFTEAAARAAQETAVRELAICSAVGLIAGTIAKCEFKTYRNGEEQKGDEYYLWNVKANANESAYRFIQKLITKLCFFGECLVVFSDDQALVADDFSLKREYALYPNLYYGVSVNNFIFDREFRADEVLHFKADNGDAKRLIDLFCESYQGLLTSSMRAFTKTRGEKGVVEVSRTVGSADYEGTVTRLMNESFRPYLENDNAVLPLPEGYKYQRSAGTAGARELSDAGDTRKLINDILDLTALAFKIPPALLRGEMADLGQSVNNFLAFCIDPLCRMLESEIICKRYQKAEYLSGSRLRIDTSSVKHVDLLDAATAIDKLIASGVFSVNDLREATGAAALPKEWANQHYITRNYAKIEEMGGGESIEQSNSDQDIGASGI